MIQCSYSSAGINRTALAILVLGWVALCLPGCGGGGGRVEVTGTVSDDGRPSNRIPNCQRTAHLKEREAYDETIHDS